MHILMVEDEKHDYQIAKRALDKSDLPCEITWVPSGEEALKRLQTDPFDIVLTDFKLPGISGLETFEQIIAQGLDVPVVFITGSGNESVAVEALKLGAQDYLVKDSAGEYLRLLPTVMRKARIQWEDRQARKQAEHALQESEKKYQQLIEYAPAGIYEVDLTTGRFTSVNDVMCKYTGYTREEFLSMSPVDLATEDFKELALERQAKILAGEQVPETVEYKVRGKGGREFWAMVNTGVIY